MNSISGFRVHALRRVHMQKRQAALSSSAATVELVEPSLDWLPGYVAALEIGWSPSAIRDLSGKHLDAIRVDARAFLSDLTRREGSTVTLADGTSVPRLPGRVFWISDGEFCGFVSRRRASVMLYER